MAEQSRAPRKRFWYDPRLAIGLGLIGASVAGVLALVSTADATVQVLAARDALAPGDRIDAGDLVATSVRLADVDLYLSPGELPDDGLVITRAVDAGELVPASAVGATAGIGLASVVVTINGQPPASISPGATADLWASRQEETNSFGPPSVIVSGATVVRIIEPEGLVSAGDVTTLEILIPRLRVARVLEAIANQDALSVIPTGIPIKD
jgi:flagella basal body P-ring formation protein FlgA